MTSSLHGRCCDTSSIIIVVALATGEARALDVIHPLLTGNLAPNRLQAWAARLERREVAVGHREVVVRSSDAVVDHATIVKGGRIGGGKNVAVTCESGLGRTDERHLRDRCGAMAVFWRAKTALLGVGHHIATGVGGEEVGVVAASGDWCNVRVSGCKCAAARRRVTLGGNSPRPVCPLKVVAEFHARVLVVDTAWDGSLTRVPPGA
mmetsp:Transcript_35964/g.94313  ORF Transcript_35964/g.94313 Transcript_35964/m.94313 type:complete len:207 (-) Transcript_35964:455-1075(-)